MGRLCQLNTATTKLLVILVVVVVVVEAATPRKLRCPSKCGNVAIPYPFGIGDGCHYNNHYEITCNHTYYPPKPIYGRNMEVLHIGLLEGKLRVNIYASVACYDKNGTQTRANQPSLTLSTFKISISDNIFAAIGCDTYAWFSGTRYNRSYSTGCMTVCNSPDDVVNGSCSGVGCCETAIPDGVQHITRIKAMSLHNHTNVSSFNPCSSAFVVAKDALNGFSLANLTRVPEHDPMTPVVLDWMIGKENCSTARANGNCLCKGNSTCDDSATNGEGYNCKCLKGYSGNPYLEHGCQDVNECADQEHDCEKSEYCFNTVGNYTCQCPKGFHGLGTKSDHCVRDKRPFLILAVGIIGGIIASTFIVVWLYWQREKNQMLKARQRFFRQNGGHLLHQKNSTCGEVSAEVVKIFTIEELETATNKYSDENIIGKGGFGVVYKGVLANNQVVAIKKSLKVDPKQSEQFINEVIVVSQLNNRNVVKLLGCCLETEVPLLVYEFIDNGTLYDHLYDERKASLLTWNIRLKIASQVADVLSYLHTTISIPIIHRDMKSSNILLDGNNYTAKVSDFGASRLVPIDEEQLATVVLGTCGYLDPEYLQTSELTHKSDVYSFGVVLVELLTRLKALSYDRPEKDRNLAIFFLRKLNEEHHLIEILDDIIMRDDGAIEQVVEVAKLAQRCLKLEGKDRPTMKEVAMELQRIRGMVSGSHPWSTNSGKVPKEETTVLLGNTAQVDSNEMSYNRNNTMDSSTSQVVALLGASLGSGR